MLCGLFPSHKISPSVKPCVLILQFDTKRVFLKGASGKECEVVKLHSDLPSTIIINELYNEIKQYYYIFDRKCLINKFIKKNPLIIINYIKEFYYETEKRSFILVEYTNLYKDSVFPPLLRFWLLTPGNQEIDFVWTKRVKPIEVYPFWYVESD